MSNPARQRRFIPRHPREIAAIEATSKTIRVSSRGEAVDFRCCGEFFRQIPLSLPRVRWIE